MIKFFNVLILVYACHLPCYSFVTVEELTLEEKVGQLLMVNFIGEVPNADAKALIQDLHIGSIIYYNWANTLNNPKQVSDLSNGLQTLASDARMPIPLIIAIDQEGGIVNRLNEGFTVFPGNMALGVTGKPELAELSAFYMGEEMRAVGINMNLAPVVDVNTNPRNPIIGIRSFGNSPKLVASFAHRALHGYHRAGMITALKHFPGHGDVEVDSHKNLPVLRKSKAELEQTELLPFKILASETDVIVTAHLLATALDDKHCATLSKKTLDLLRKEIGFEGVICADSLIMEGILKNCSSIEEAVACAFEAGCDLLMLGGRLLVDKETNKELSVDDIQRIHCFLVNAIRNGRFPEEKVDCSVKRILNLKKKYLVSKKQQQTSIRSEHTKLAKKIAQLAVRTDYNGATISLAHSRIAFYAPLFVQDSVKKTALLQMGIESKSLFFSTLADKQYKEALSIAEDANVLIFCSYNAWKSEHQARMIKTLLLQNKPTILIVLGDPLDAELFSDATHVIKTFSPVPYSIEAVYEILKLD